MSRPSLDITIVTSMPRLIHGFLSSLYQHYPLDKVDMRTHVVWNGEGHGLGPLPPELPQKYPWAEWEARAVDGFTLNQNHLIQRCTGDYILVLNDDLIMLEHSIDRAVDYMERHLDVGMLGPRLLNPDGSLQPSTYSFPGLLRAALSVSGWRSFIPLTSWLSPLAQLMGMGKGKSRYWEHDATVDVDIFRGAYMLVRRATLEQVGLMDERGGIETEWAARFHKHGWRVVFFHESEVIHLGSQTVAHDPNREFSYLEIMLCFYHSHRPGWRFAAFVLWCLLFYSGQYLYAEGKRDRPLAIASLRALNAARRWSRTNPRVPSLTATEESQATAQ